MRRLLVLPLRCKLNHTSYLGSGQQAASAHENKGKQVAWAGLLLRLRLLRLIKMK
jgi:hypothetical protein